MMSAETADLSTHAIGPVRLLLGSLVLLLAGAAGHWWLEGRAATGRDVLVLRDGPVEIEPWSGDLRAEGSTLHWDHAVTGIQLLIAKAGSDDEEYVVLDPITVPEAKSLVVDFRVGNVRTVEKAMVLSMDDSGVKIAVNEGELARKGDVWAHTGFLQNGQRKR